MLDFNLVLLSGPVLYLVLLPLSECCLLLCAVGATAAADASLQEWIQLPARGYYGKVRRGAGDCLPSWGPGFACAHADFRRRVDEGRRPTDGYDRHDERAAVGGVRPAGTARIYQ